MKRRMMHQLIAWKNSAHRKPLILDGACQTGKSWLVQEFGRTQFDSLAYVSLENNDSMNQLFAGSLRPQRLLAGIALASQTRIEPGKTLIVLDEVQAIPRAVEALKYFAEEAAEYALIATGSSLGITIHPEISHSVSKVDRCRLYPMTFLEFLDAAGKEDLRQIVENADFDMMRVFHGQLMEWLKYYMVVGGMPEAVEAFAASYPGVDFERITRVQHDILQGYRGDFSKYADDMPKGFSLRLSQVWDSIPSQLARENKKFLYGAVRSGGRGKDFELAIQRLLDSSIALKVGRVTSPEYPLKSFDDCNAFKLFSSDVGLLRQMSGIDPQIVLDGDTVFGSAKGAFAEQLVCQELIAYGYEPRYWTNANSTNELDFVIQSENCVVPIEVKSGVNLHAKSLKAAIKRFGFEHPVRFSALPARKDGCIQDLPLYAVAALAKL
ncbi:ATP-binding protein [Bifidobacterium panos]|uniref:ATPase n=1 Tax=Bifidobacterium panos TaxID=2675321 RepID=A0ABX1SXT7_9BIFI|nr:ATPase [Bifidobacterium sp. DSM 109963]